MAAKDEKIIVDLSQGTFVDTVFKNGVLQLVEIGIDSLGQKVYADQGHWISSVITYPDKFKEYKNMEFAPTVQEGASYKISVSSSDNMATWSEYIEIDSQNMILNEKSNYVRIKIELFASKAHSEMLVDSFTTNGYSNDQIVVASGKLKLNKNQTLNGTIDSSAVPTVLSTDINKTNLKKINSVGYEGSPQSAIKTLILSDGEYKKYVSSYDYSSPLDTTDSAKSKLTNLFKFDEASGNVTDSKGSAVGTINGGVTRVAGYNGQGSALSFNGTTGYVQFNQKAIPTGSKMSIRLRIKTQSNASGRLLATSHGGNAGIIVGYQGATTKSISVYAHNGSTAVNLVGIKPVNDNQWHDILFIWNGSSENGAKLYIDDMSNPDSMTTFSISIPSHTYDLRLAMDANSIALPFEGLIDNLEIYNDVITIDELFPVLKLWASVSTTLPTAEHFLEHGMDDLSVLDRKLTTLTLPTSSRQVLGDGKVYKATIDLKKIIDLKSISLE